MEFSGKRLGEKYEEPQPVDEMVLKFLDGDMQTTIAFLRAHPDQVSEFCIRVKETYREDDSLTPVIKLSMLIQELL